MRTTYQRLLSFLIFALLLLLAPSCRQAASQSTAVTEDNDSLKWVRDIDIPSTLPDSVAEQILYRKAYIVSYNKDRLQPNWVAWHLTAEHVDGNVPRPNLAFHEDKDVPEPKAYHWDYRYEEDKHIDRGHMCPAGDNKRDKEAMYESFLMTNICPQHKALNSGIWNTIEKRCREWARIHLPQQRRHPQKRPLHQQHKRSGANHRSHLLSKHRRSDKGESQRHL